MLVIRKSVLSLVVMTIVSFMSGSVLAHSDHADPMSAYYGNTWEFKAVGEHKFVQINEDMSMVLLFADGQVYEGVWDINGKKTCFSVGDDSSCFDDLLGRKLGEHWVGTHDGHSYDGIIHKGRKSAEAFLAE